MGAQVAAVTMEATVGQSAAADTDLLRHQLHQLRPRQATLDSGAPQQGI